MNAIKTFSLSRHGQLFSVPDNSRGYLFIQALHHPYMEEPYRAESYAIAYLKTGSIQLQAGLSSFKVDAPAIIGMAPSVIRSFSNSSAIMALDILFFKDAFLMEKQSNPFFLAANDFFENNELNVLQLSSPLDIKIKNIFSLINLTRATANHHTDDIIRHYIFVLIYEINDYYKQQQSELKSLRQLNTIVAKFRKLLAENYMRERKLDFYADRLNVTAKYLSATMKLHTGKSAAEWIDDAIILEAKVLLQNLSYSIAQVSNQLNFTDQSTFGKFFKSKTALSPIDYRKRF